MVAFTKIFVSSAAISTACAAATPNIYKRQSHPVDFEEACKQFPPASGQVGITTSGGITVVWDGNNLGNGSSDKLVAFHDDSCNILTIVEAEPQSPGFKFEFPLPIIEEDGNVQIKEIVIHQGWIGSDSISVPRVELDGVEIMRWCDDHQTGMDGINMGYWRTCNFNRNTDVTP